MTDKPGPRPVMGEIALYQAIEAVTIADQAPSNPSELAEQITTAVVACLPPARPVVDRDALAEWFHEREHKHRWPCTIGANCANLRVAQYRTDAILASGVVQDAADVRRHALMDAADAWQRGQWADAPRCSDRVQERIANGQFVQDWLRARAAREAGARDG